MARIRSLKPETWTSRTLASVSRDARLTFIGLWNYCDDEGRAVDDARLVKAAVWPLDDEISAEVVEEHLAELAARKVIIRYEAEAKPLLAVTNWTEHQKISHPTPSRYPTPPTRSRKTPTLSGTNREPSGSRARALEQGTGNREQGTGRGTSSTTVDPPFENFWDAYPARNGKKLHKAQAVRIWARMSEQQKTDAAAAVGHYAAACEADLAGTKDAFRWLRDRSWTDWQTPAVAKPRVVEPASWAGIREWHESRQQQHGQAVGELPA